MDCLTELACPDKWCTGLLIIRATHYGEVMDKKYAWEWEIYCPECLERWITLSEASDRYGR